MKFDKLLKSWKRKRNMYQKFAKSQNVGSEEWLINEVIASNMDQMILELEKLLEVKRQ